MQLEKFILLLFLASLTSCLPSAYLVREFQGYPEDLSKKEFIDYNLKKNNGLNKQFISFKKWNRENDNVMFVEKHFFDLTYFKQPNELIIFESVKTLSELKKKAWVLPPIYEEVFGVQGTIWVSKKKRLQINKIQDENLSKLYESTTLYLNKKQSNMLFGIYKQAQYLKKNSLK